MSAIDRLPDGEWAEPGETPVDQIGHAAGVAIGEHDPGPIVRLLLVVHSPHDGPCETARDRLIELDADTVAEINEVWPTVRGLLS